jgi:hypothetical protein
LYGRTKVGIVGERAAALSAPPASQPDHLGDRLIARHPPQLASPQIVRGEVSLFAVGTTRPVAGAVPANPSHLVVVFLDSLPQTVDTDTSLFLVERGSSANLASLHFFVASPTRAQKVGGVPDAIYKGGVSGGVWRRQSGVK